MFELLLFNLRARGIKVGLMEWLRFLDGVERGLAVDLESLYRFGRAVLVHSEGQFDAWDVAFKATFEGVELPPEISDALRAWLSEAHDNVGPLEHIDMTDEELRRELMKRLAEQKERHDGGSRWVGTGGTSPFGHSGRADKGIRVEGSGGNRSAIAVAAERRWSDYRTDTRLQVRDFKVAMRALRNLVREGELELDLDGTIERTANNGGDIELDWRRRRDNRMRLLLLMDSGGSMSPHARLVSRLFTAASELKGFRSIDMFYFHNAPYGWLYKSYERWERTRIETLLSEWTPKHRVIFVGDASMAPYELFSPFGLARRDGGHSGLDWLQQIRLRCPASIWLNPDPQRWWDHPTVRAIGNMFPMFPLTVSGLRDGVRRLRVAA